MEGVTNVLVLEDNELGFTNVRRQVLAKYSNAMLVRATGMKQLRDRAGWAAFDLVLVNFSLPEYEALNALLFAREHFPTLPFIMVVDKRKKYSEADIAIIKQADGCVYQEELFGHVDIIDGLMKLSRKKYKTDVSAVGRSFKLSKVISLIQGGSGFDERREVLSLLGEIDQHSQGGRPPNEESPDAGTGHRAVLTDSYGDDPHVLMGAAAGAGEVFEA